MPDKSFVYSITKKIKIVTKTNPPGPIHKAGGYDMIIYVHTNNNHEVMPLPQLLIVNQKTYQYSYKMAKMALHIFLDALFMVIFSVSLYSY